ncbi:hypothetical protein QNN03_05160 [Streptomyces sp. GXMU-J15]|uniref:Protein-L-isoaspartate O-methyltransferase n=1 Tax=Streptomyces fuscus TaxID=3048495 RepID=A0ABT7IUH6_9ACTN|nr:hypothetical protein [Streptomyces sp. DI166]MDL2075821.1 hypothetical protein [Streptomyces fuscus]
MTTSPDIEVTDASELRRQLVEQLRADSHIRSAAVERAFRTVPRHAFGPETPLTAAYANDIVPTRHSDDGTITSSLSAPWLQADMLEAARIQPGHRVLEIGSGGYNAPSCCRHRHRPPPSPASSPPRPGRGPAGLRPARSSASPARDRDSTQAVGAAYRVHRRRRGDPGGGDAAELTRPPTPPRLLPRPSL